jgi:hypothetical protein
LKAFAAIRLRESWGYLISTLGRTIHGAESAAAIGASLHARVTFVGPRCAQGNSSACSGIGPLVTPVVSVIHQNGGQSIGQSI